MSIPTRVGSLLVLFAGLVPVHGCAASPHPPEGEAAQFDRLTLAEARKRYVFFWALSAPLEFRRQLERELPGENRRALEKLRDSLKVLLSDANEEQPLELIRELLKSPHPELREMAFRIIRKGRFEEALPDLEAVSPERAREAREDFAAEDAPDEPAPDPVQMRAQMFQKIRQHAGAPLGAADAINTRDDLFLGQVGDWIDKNEASVGCVTEFRSSYGGILYLDEDARACGVPWPEWFRLSQPERESRLATAGARPYSKYLTIEIALREHEAEVNGLNQRSEDFEKGSKGLEYVALYWKKRLQRRLPTWQLHILLTGDAAETRVLAERLRFLGFEVVDAGR